MYINVTPNSHNNRWALHLVPLYVDASVEHDVQQVAVGHAAGVVRVGQARAVRVQQVRVQQLRVVAAAPAAAARAALLAGRLCGHLHEKLVKN